MDSSSMNIIKALRQSAQACNIMQKDFKILNIQINPPKTDFIIFSFEKIIDTISSWRLI